MDSVFPKPYDDDIQAVAEGVAIVIDGDMAPKAITSGQYLFIKNHSTLATGGYHATDDIASGGTVSSSNVAADADGVVNAAYSALNSNIANINNKMQFGGTLTGDVKTVIANLPNNSICFYFNSNKPDNRPTNCDWGGYIFFKTSIGARCLYIDGSHFATGYYEGGSISWNILH